MGDISTQVAEKLQKKIVNASQLLECLFEESVKENTKRYSDYTMNQSAETNFDIIFGT